MPLLVGYNATGKFNAAKSHLAKLRTIQRYLTSLDAQDDDDLVLAVDGYDVIQQLPPEIVIKRYFALCDQADERLAKRFGTDMQDIRNRNFHTTIFFAANKLCGPVNWKRDGCPKHCVLDNNYEFGACQKICLIDWSQPRCWAVPESTLPRNAYGPQTNNGSLEFMDPRWMNSGTIIGPVAHLRTYLEATLEEMNKTYHLESRHIREFDQLYLTKVWAIQEYRRSKIANDNDHASEIHVNRSMPENHTGKEQTEYHVGIDYESSISLAKYGNEPAIGWSKFNHEGLTTEMGRDVFGIGGSFKPYHLQMPLDVSTTLKRLYRSISKSHTQAKADEWVSNVDLHVNYVTKHVFTLWHCTGKNKTEWMRDEFKRYWFYPFARDLLKASVGSLQGELVPITDEIIGGRRWTHKLAYPTKGSELGGAYTDFDGGSFLDWNTLCAKHAPVLFAGGNHSAIS